MAEIDLAVALQNLIQVGEVIEADYDAARVRVQLKDLKTAWIRWGVQRAGDDISWWTPTVGEQVVVVFPFADFEGGVVLTSLYSNSHPAPANKSTIKKFTLNDGADFSYNSESHVLSVNLPGGGQTKLVSDGGIEMTGDTTINGKLHVTDDIKGDAEIQDAVRTMSSDRQIFNSHTHTGDSGGTTSNPGQQQ